MGLDLATFSQYQSTAQRFAQPAPHKPGQAAPHEQAAQSSNRIDEVYKGPGDNFFGTLSASRPEIYPIYWSQAQMQARQSEEMANAQSFLNRLWTFESDGKQWFNPDVSVIYPDRPPPPCAR